jgi:acyl-coenzyme A thioesterase PaaI-like protein
MSLSLQESLYPELTCFGCGPANERGLRLRSYRSEPEEEGGYVASFTPWPEHDNGVGFLNGGIIGTLLDCHSAAAVVDTAAANGWGSLGDALLPYLTAGLDVRYRRPAPLREPVTLRAEVTAASEPAITVHVWLEHDGKLRAEADALWKRWRPRPSGT